MRERLKGPPPESLAGSLLIAHPALRDPNFRRTVLLMSSHDGEGAMGVVLNRPLGRRLAELSGEYTLGPLASVPVYQGGPVQTEQLLLAAWQPQEGGFKLQFGIEPEKAAQLAGEDDIHIRAFLGYSGWSSGQLEKELEQNTWVTASVPSDLMDQSQDETLWRHILRGLSHNWRLLADEPEDNSRN